MSSMVLFNVFDSDQCNFIFTYDYFRYFSIRIVQFSIHWYVFLANLCERRQSSCHKDRQIQTHKQQIQNNQTEATIRIFQCLAVHTIQEDLNDSDKNQ